MKLSKYAKDKRTDEYLQLVNASLDVHYNYSSKQTQFRFILTFRKHGTNQFTYKQVKVVDVSIDDTERIINLMNGLSHSVQGTQEESSALSHESLSCQEKPPSVSDNH